MNVFDIVGPIMIGPSSSHTAGACRIGNYARAIFNVEPLDVEIIFSGSFARTYKGHGTDKALIAGLMGFDTGDINIRNSLDIAKEKGYNISISTFDFEDVHPNTCKIIYKNHKNNEIMASSIGGGNILINKINDTIVEINGLYDVLIINHKDKPGMMYKFTKQLYKENININGVSLSRVEKRKEATIVIAVDDNVDDGICDKLRELDNVYSVSLLHKM